MTNEILTEGIDYSGCNEKIYLELREGRKVKCEVPGFADPIWIVAYIKGSNGSYVDAYARKHSTAVPVGKPKFKVKKASEIMLLLEESHEVSEVGNWSGNKEPTFCREMWFYCGKSPNNKWTWKPEWLEEVE